MVAFFKQIETWEKKKTFLTVFLAGAVAFGISYAIASAAGPQFNIFPISYTGGENKDLPLLDGRNMTRGEDWSVSQADHNAGVVARPGEVMQFSVYYHNGAPDKEKNIAKNTIIKAFERDGQLRTASAQHVISATISADNAAAVNSSSKGGDIVVKGEGGQAITLSLVPGSVKHFPNQGTSPKPGPRQLPDTIFGSGVNIGDVRGCFEFHGFVNFQLRVDGEGPEGRELAVQKLVQNVSRGSALVDDEVTAEPGDQILFRINIVSSGGAVDNVKVRDKIDSLLRGSVHDFTLDGQPVSAAFISQFFSDGADIGTVKQAGSRKIRFRTNVPASSAFTTGSHLLRNKAIAFVGDKTVADDASVRVNIGAEPPTLGKISIEKLVGNVTQGIGVTDVAVNARVGDVVNYIVKLKIGSQGGVVNNVVVKDVIDPRLRPTVFAVSLDGRDLSGSEISQLFGSGLNIGNVGGPGDHTRHIRFRAKVPNLPPGRHILDNVAITDSLRDHAKVIVVVGEPEAQFDLAVSKQVKNVRDRTDFQDIVNANPDETVRFRISVSASGNRAQTNVVLKDTLPGRLDFMEGSVEVDNQRISEGNKLFADGLNLGQMPTGGKKVITFEAKVKGGEAATLTNAAVVRSDQVGPKRDEARVRVAGRPEAQRELAIRKQVQNVITGTDFRNQVEAKRGDTIKFKILVTAEGNAGQRDVILADNLPAGLEFVRGSVRVDGNRKDDDQLLVSSEGLNLGRISAGGKAEVFFDTRVTTDREDTLKNVATVKSAQVGPRADEAFVKVVGRIVVVTERDISISKTVRNRSDGPDFADSVQAAAGNRVTFRIEIRTTGNASQPGVSVGDFLPSRLDFDEGTLRLDGSILSAAQEDDFFEDNDLSLGTLPANTTRVIEFEAFVVGSESAILINRANVNSPTVGGREDEARVTVSAPAAPEEPDRELRVVKEVSNLTRGTGFGSSVSARTGDRVRFEINVTNTGDARQTNVRVRDALPTGLSFISGSGTIDGDDDDIFGLLGSGLNIGSLDEDETVTIGFDATVTASGNLTLTNRAFARSDQVSERQDQAQVFVSAAVAGAQFAQSKSAFNNTKGVDATTVAADPADVITYTLTFRNTGGITLTNVIIEDNISDILELATIVNQGGAREVTGGVIRWDRVDVAAGSQVARTFQVRVKQAGEIPSTSDLLMVNFFGNEVRVSVRLVLGAALPPRTGAGEWLAGALAVLSTAGYWIYKKKLFLKLL